VLSRVRRALARHPRYRRMRDFSLPNSFAIPPPDISPSLADSSHGIDLPYTG